MDPISAVGLAASIIACIQLIGTLLKRVGPSDHNKKDLAHIQRVLYGIHGAYQGLKLHLDLNEEDRVRLSELDLEGSLRACKEVLDVLSERLRTVTFVGQYIVGRLWDGKLKKCVKRLEDAKELFELALHADHSIVLSAIKHYVENANENLLNVKAVVNENGKRLLDIDQQAQDHHKEIETWHAAASNDVSALSHNLEAYNNAVLMQHTETNENIHLVRTDIQGHNQDWTEEVKQKEKDEQRDKILKWLFKTDPSTIHNDACSRHQPGTGNWILEDGQYEHWKNMPNSFLWLHGIPGCGKSILCSTIVENITAYSRAQCLVNGDTDSICSVAFFYCSFSDSEKQKTRNLICSLLAQLFRGHSRTPDSLLQLYNQYKNGQPPAELLLLALRDVLVYLGQVFIIIDALDECPMKTGDRKEILSTLCAISSWSLQNVHLLVTSRKELDIERVISGLVTCPPICIQGDQVANDVRLYVGSQLSADPDLQKWSKAVKEEIEATLVDGAHGMFRWVFCQLEALKKCIVRSDIRRTLRLLPKTLDETYARILQGIDDVYHQKAIAALQWLAFSKRPLKITELAEAIIIDPHTDPPYDPEDRLPNPYDVLKILSSLATTSISIYWGEDRHLWGSEVEEVQLAHYSVREYLVSNRVKSPQVECFRTTDVVAHGAIAKSCVLYLKCITIPKRKFPMGIDFDEVYLPGANNQKYPDGIPLLLYAGTFWYRHITAIDDGADKLLLHLVSEFLHSRADLYKWLWVLAKTATNDEWCELYSKPVGTPLYFACFLQLSRLVKMLLEKGADVNEQSGCHGRAFIVACNRGHEGIIKLLLDADADINAQGGSYHTALQAACGCRDNESVVRLLLDKGADVNAKGGKYNTALQVACYRGNESVVRLLLDKGADVNARGGIYNTALQAACYRGNESVLRIAAESRFSWRTDIIKLLLKYGATWPDGVYPEEYRHVLEEKSE